jgi:hypothetical protein
MLLFLMPLSVTLAYIPGPSVPMFVPLKSSSSKNSQVPERMISEEMLLPHFPRSFMFPKRWVWSPRKFSLSNAMIWGISPDERPGSPAVAPGEYTWPTTNSRAAAMTMIFDITNLLSRLHRGLTWCRRGPRVSEHPGHATADQHERPTSSHPRGSCRTGLGPRTTPPGWGASPRERPRHAWRKRSNPSGVGVYTRCGGG